MGTITEGKPKVTRRETAARIISYVKDNPFFGYEEVERGEIFKGVFMVEAVKYCFTIDEKNSDGKHLDVCREDGGRLSEVALTKMLEHVKAAYVGYILNKYDLK